MYLAGRPSVSFHEVRSEAATTAFEEIDATALLFARTFSDEAGSEAITRPESAFPSTVPPSDVTASTTAASWPAAAWTSTLTSATAPAWALVASARSALSSLSVPVVVCAHAGRALSSRTASRMRTCFI